jgi:asparagine synthase (glutamine-hydrolysing)
MPARTIARMNDLLRHRGPDDEGFLLVTPSASEPVPLVAPVACAGPDTPPSAVSADLPYAPSSGIEQWADAEATLALGHRRLSIVDLAPTGHQPMCSGDRRYWIVFNGEIYNHVELRVELEALGCRFRSRSDTEVILAAYATWGEKCLSRFNGMWAFAIYDTTRHELFLARDRFGIKPLYYWAAPDGTFCFGSEIKLFTAHPGWSATLNPQRAYDFMVWGLIDHTDETLFRRVYQVRPGHCMTLQVPRFFIEADGRVPASKWYELRPERFAGTFDDAAHAFRERFTDAVRLHLRADVAVGSCLSGGLDSSSIVCVANRLLNEQGASAMQKSFSACADEKRFDERQWIDEVVRATGVDAQYVYPTLEDLFEEAPSITWHQDEPFSSSSIYAQWSVFRLASKGGVKVMLDGQGADELLAGYHSYFGPRFAGLLRSRQWLQLWSEIRDTKRIHGYSELHALMWVANVLLPEGARQPLRAWSKRTTSKPAWLNLDRLGAAPIDPVVQAGKGVRSVDEMSRAQLTATSLQMLLHWEDRNSMAHSIESRVPFLDYRLVEFVLGLPDDFKLAQGMTKRVLRAGMSGILPDRIRDRVSKLGFATPEEVWLRERASDRFRQKMKHAVGICEGILGDGCVDMLEDMIAGRRPFSFLAWRLICFGEWIETFGVRTGHSARALPKNELNAVATSHSVDAMKG